MTLIQKFFNMESLTDVLPLFPWFFGFIYYKKHETPFLWMTVLSFGVAWWVQYVWDGVKKEIEDNVYAREVEAELVVLRRKAKRHGGRVRI